MKGVPKSNRTSIKMKNLVPDTTMVKNKVKVNRKIKKSKTKFLKRQKKSSMNPLFPGIKNEFRNKFD